MTEDNGGIEHNGGIEDNGGTEDNQNLDLCLLDGHNCYLQLIQGQQQIA